MKNSIGIQEIWNAFNEGTIVYRWDFGSNDRINTPFQIVGMEFKSFGGTATITLQSTKQLFRIVHLSMFIGRGDSTIDFDLPTQQYKLPPIV